MYILFNEMGELVTAIPHGQTVRQGNAFDMYVCFPNKAEFGNLSPFVEFKVDGKFRLMGSNDYDCWGKRFVFHPTDENEAAFGFVDGHTYRAYHIAVPNGATVDHGALPFIASVILSNGVERQGKGTISVLATYGSDEREETEGANIDFLLSEMKKSMLLYEYASISAQSAVFGTDLLSAYQWKTIGFVSGSFTMRMPLSEAIAENGYAKVATFDGASGVLCPSILFGHDQSGEDVELRVYEDGDGHTAIAVNVNSAIEEGDVVYVAGMYSSRLAEEEEFTLIVQDEETDALARVRLVEGSIGSDMLGRGSVGTSQLADNSVVRDKLNARTESLIDYWERVQFDPSSRLNLAIGFRRLIAQEDCYTLSIDYSNGAEFGTVFIGIDDQNHPMWTLSTDMATQHVIMSDEDAVEFRDDFAPYMNITYIM